MLSKIQNKKKSKLQYRIEFIITLYKSMPSKKMVKTLIKIVAIVLQL